MPLTDEEIAEKARKSTAAAPAVPADDEKGAWLQKATPEDVQEWYKRSPAGSNRKVSSNPDARMRQLANLRYFKITPPDKGNDTRRRNAGIRERIRLGLKMQLNAQTRARFKTEYDIDIDEGITYAEAITAKILLQALHEGASGDKAVDQILATEPKLLQVEDTTPRDPRMNSAALLSKLSSEQIRALRDIQKTLAAEVSEIIDVTPSESDPNPESENVDS